MLTFTTKYPCPVPFISGGGHGEYGLCAMEVVSIVTGEDTFVPNADVASVHPSLRDLMIATNDTLPNDVLPGEVRADSLWPIIPSILGTGNLGTKIDPDAPLTPQEHFAISFLSGFPIVEYAAALNENLIHARYTAPRNILMAYVSRVINPIDKWERAVHAMKVGTEVFWEKFREGVLPRTEFTAREMERLEDYLLSRAGNPYLERKDKKGVLAVA